MDVSKFSIDRNSYLSVAAASAGSLYDTAAKSASSNNATAAAYSAYLDPSVLTKAYFDSKLYQDRNYLDISKIYSSAAHHQSQQQQQHQQHQPHQHHQHLHQQQQIHQHGITALALSSGRTNSIDERESQTPQLSEGSNDIKPHMIVSGADSESVSGGGPLSGNYSAYQYASDANNTATAAGSGEYRRPLTVIF